MLGKVKEIAIPVAILVIAAQYFGFIGAGPKSPDFIKKAQG